VVHDLENRPLDSGTVESDGTRSIETKDLHGGATMPGKKTYCRCPRHACCCGSPLQGAWEDMLQEAITRVLTDARVRPEGVTMVAFVAGILRSLRTDYWRRVRRELRADHSRIQHEDGDESSVLVDPTPGPERVLEARQQLARIKLLF
jgi:hypothetical protein